MKIIKLLFASLYTAIPLMGIYAIAIAVATFIENDYGSNAARVLIYNTWFFNFLHLWLLVCLIGVLIRYKFLAQKKYASFILHLSFVIIIVGAGITRFFGVEGLMNIREGQSNSAFVSSEIFLNVLLSNDESKYAIHIPVSVSYASNKMLNEKIAFGDSHFRIKSTAITKLTSDKKDTTAQMEAVISYKDKDYPLILIGGGQMSEDSVVSFDDGTNAILSWGARDIDLGFSIKLEDFILERYAGSNSPSSYKSKVVVIDGEKEMPYDIFMNNVLDYKGYRFFQSSYDMDELGTILSVNNDPGKIPTYIGYFLLFVACVWLLFAKNSRFQKLSRFLKNQQIYSVIFALVIFGFNAQYLSAESPKTPESTAIQSQNILDYINNMREKSKAHAQKFGTLQIQSNDGKIKPLDTLASDLVHKMTKKNNFLGFSNTQIALGMLLYPNDWKNIKMIRISTPQLRELLGLPKDEKYASFMDLFIANNGESSTSGEYKLKNYIEEANRKSPANRSKFDNDIIDVDERANIAYGIYSSQFFRFLPIPQNGEIWISPIEMLSFAGDELAGKIQAMLSNYFNAFEVGLQSGDFEKADEALQIIKDYQKEFGGAIMISDSKLKAEIFLNNSNLFAKLILPYILVGIAMFILIFAYIFKPKDSLKRALKCFYFISCAIILVHLFALILRWYIAGHAPWSNAYESMLYIAFTAGIAGVVFFRKSYLALSSANFLAGIALFVANLGFMNPQITNLMPVLKSYWLNIHVSVITASYGFLGLCFLLGVITLMLMICRKKGVDSANLNANQSADSANQSANPTDSSTANLTLDSTNPANLKIDSTINSITAINEMSMIFGLFLLTAGNFLGGIWANESWGRYWGWDPKETWALVSIGVYAIILHLRFIFKRNFQYIFATASVLGFFSVLMTYFGVNYYLSGLHSYAAGDPLPIPKFLYFMVAFLVILIIIAFLKRKMEAVKI